MNAICPECGAGKCRNCDHLALVDDDRFVPCQCSHREGAGKCDRCDRPATRMVGESNEILACDLHAEIDDLRSQHPFRRVEELRAEVRRLTEYADHTSCVESYTALLAEKDAEIERRIVPWSCPECAFAFDATHTDLDGGGHTCPACEEHRLTAALAAEKAAHGELRERVRALADEFETKAGDHLHAAVVAGPEDKGLLQIACWGARTNSARDLLALLDTDTTTGEYQPCSAECGGCPTCDPGLRPTDTTTTKEVCGKPRRYFPQQTCTLAVGHDGDHEDSTHLWEA